MHVRAEHIDGVLLARDADETDAAAGSFGQASAKRDCPGKDSSAQSSKRRRGDLGSYTRGEGVLVCIRLEKIEKIRQHTHE